MRFAVNIPKEISLHWTLVSWNKAYTPKSGDGSQCDKLKRIEWILRPQCSTFDIVKPLGFRELLFQIEKQFWKIFDANISFKNYSKIPPNILIQTNNFSGTNIGWDDIGNIFFVKPSTHVHFQYMNKKIFELFIFSFKLFKTYFTIFAGLIV